MSSFTTPLTLSKLVGAFGGASPYGMTYMYRGLGGLVPGDWRVLGNTAITTSKSSLNPVSRYVGGGYEPSFKARCYPAQGPDEPAGSIYAAECSVWGYAGLTGAITYGNCGNRINSEGWELIQLACVAEKLSGFDGGRWGIVITLRTDKEKIAPTMYTSKQPMSFTMSNGITGTYTDTDADSDVAFQLLGYSLRQLFWDVAAKGPLNSADYNPFEGRQPDCTMNRLSYETQP